MYLRKKSYNFKQSLNKNQSGFTLIELVLATILITTVIAGLYSSMMTATHMILPMTSVGQNLARQQMEDMREAVRRDWWGVPYDPLVSGSDAVINVGVVGKPLTLPPVLGQNSSPVQTTVDGITYTMTYKVTPIYAGSPSAATRDYRRVQVDVTW